MKVISASLVVLIGCLTLVDCSLTLIPTAISTAMLDRVNVDTYLRNQRLVESHINCLLYNPQTCDTLGNEVKRLLPIMGPRNCQSCSQEQKTKLRKILQHWQRYYPQAYRDLRRLLQSNQLPA